MELERLAEYLRGLVKDPGKLIWQISILVWLWSHLRSALRRRSESQPKPEPTGAAPDGRAQADAPDPRAAEAAAELARRAEAERSALGRGAERRSGGPAGTGQHAGAARPSERPDRAASDARSVPVSRMEALRRRMEQEAEQRGARLKDKAEQRGAQAEQKAQERGAQARQRASGRGAQATRESRRHAARPAQDRAGSSGSVGPAEAPDRERERRDWERALEEAHAIRAAMIGRSDLAWLEPVLVGELLEPLQAARDRARQRVAAHGGDGAREPGRAEKDPRRARDALRLLEVMRRALSERAHSDDARRHAQSEEARRLGRSEDARRFAPSEDARRLGQSEDAGRFAPLEGGRRHAPSEDALRLAEADAVLEALHAPLRAHADAENVALRGRRVLALRSPLPAAAGNPRDRSDAAGWRRELMLIPVSAGFGSQLEDFFDLAQTLGRHWYHAVPELEAECLTRLELTPRRRPPDPRRGYDENSVRDSFAYWLPALFADTALSLRWGAGYVSALGRRLRPISQPTAARTAGVALSDEPPAWLRLNVALGALRALGQDREADRQLELFRAVHPQLEESYLPLSGGAHQALPSAYLVAIADSLGEFLRTQPLAALGGVPLIEISPLVQTADQARDQAVLADLWLREPPADRKDAAQLTSAAWLAPDRGADPARTLETLHRQLLPKQRTVGPTQPLETPARPLTLAAALRDPSFLLSAARLGAALEPPRSRQLRR
jgi:hypothetical protein